ncbi:MAG: hypothetical protein J6C07_06025 [Lachnospiraceae bacterium]|nr:hypothetical protein [Lachnospiraceae bacterium]
MKQGRETVTQKRIGQKIAAREIYNNIFAPALLGFVEWVLQEAKQRGIKRLYFLARDGYQMYLAADFLCKKRDLAIDCRYLYGSRYAWRLPQFALMGKDCLDMICRGGIDVTFEKVMKRGGLTNEEAKAVAEELGYANDYKRILSYSEVVQLKKPLAESNRFLPFVYAHSKGTYETTIEYLCREGLFDDVKYALVDSGWTGSLQQTLTQLLHYAGYEKKLEGFYFGLYELPVGINEESYHTYYFGPNYGLKRKVYFSNCLYEAVYSAPHGMTVGYEAGCPVFFNEHNLNQTRMEQEAEWLKEYLESYSLNGLQNKRVDADQTYQLLKRFMGNPTPEEAEIYGSLLFSDDVTEEHTQRVAAGLTKTEIKSQYVWNRILIMLGKKKQVLKDSAWIEGSVALTEGRHAWQMVNVRWYKYLIYLRKWLKRGKKR